MRVLHISDVSEMSTGGAQSFLRDLLTGLRARGHQAEVWAAVDHFTGKDQQSDNSWKQTIESFKPDVIHVHNWGYLLEQRQDLYHTGIPTVASLADYQNICPLRMRIYNWRRCSTPCRYECGFAGWDKAMIKALGNTRLVTFCPGSAGIFRAHGLEVEVIPIGLDLALWPFDPEGKGSVLSGAAYSRYFWKGYDIADEAARGFHHVHFEGGLTQPEMSRMYREAEVFLNPSWFDETFGLTMAEAMASGAVVIAFANAGARQLIENGISGYLVEMFKKDELKETLEFVMNEDNTAIKLAARKKIEQEFNLELMVRRWEDVYDKARRQ